MTTDEFPDDPLHGAYTMTEENASEFALWCNGKLVQETDAEDPKKTFWAVNYQGVDEVERAHAGDMLIFDPEKNAYVKL